MKNTLIDPVVTICHEIAKKQSVKAYLVGGCVRDFIMNLEVDDIDIMVVGDALAFCQQVSEKLTSKVSIFKSFGTAHFHYENKNYEFVSARKESYQRESRNPIVSLGSFEEDIARRDFTINSLAMSLNETDYGTIIDLYQGIKHIEDKILQTPLDPNVSFNDDPLRMLRAVRFAGRFGFEISQESQASILSNAQRLEIIKKERIHTELNKMLLSEKPSTSLLMLDKLGLMPYVMPELLLLKGIEYREGFQHKDNFLHTLEVLDNVAKVSDKLYLRWAALLHDIAKPQTKRFEPNHGWTFHGHEVLGAKMTKLIFQRLKLPMDGSLSYVVKLVSLHLRPIALTKEEISDAAVRRLIYDAADDLDDLLILCKADITSKNEVKVARYIQKLEVLKEKILEIEAKDKIRNMKLVITGELIMKTFNLKPSKVVGEIKNRVKDAVLDGLIPNEMPQAFDFMQQIAADYLEKNYEVS